MSQEPLAKAVVTIWLMTFGLTILLSLHFYYYGFWVSPDLTNASAKFELASKTYDLVLHGLLELLKLTAAAVIGFIFAKPIADAIAHRLKG